MGLGDRIRSFFAGKNNPAFAELQAWAASHRGVEGYVEPRTPTNPTSLLLVDRDGDHLRGPVREPADAFAFCKRMGIPVYDAQVIGYPSRMKDFEKKRRQIAPDTLDEDIADLERRLTEE